jgi:dTDP-4-dehydrorhamnose 3,5-epimerase-like enzyme
MATVRIVELNDQGDNRGSAYVLSRESIAFLNVLRAMHLTTLKPGHVRGNHYHVKQRETILIMHSDTWQFSWDTGIDTPEQTTHFSSSGTVLVQVEPLASHAVKNTGTRDLTILSCSDQPYDPQNPDVRSRLLI